MELLNNPEYEANPNTLTIWRQRLNSNLQSNITYKRVQPAATSGSDMHTLYAGSWGRHMTYIYLGSNPKSEANLQAAMRDGRTFASSDGSLTSFYTVVGGKEYHVGDVVPISAGTSVTLRGRAIPASSTYYISQIRLYNSSGTHVASPTPDSNGNWSWATPQISADTWYRVELVTTDMTLLYTSYSNPIIIDVL